MFETVKWHDGSNLSVADFVMSMIVGFDWATPESANYDENQVPGLDNFRTIFKGVQIESTDPLRICTYADQTFKDAELLVSGISPSIYDWWPDYSYGEAPWESLAIGNITDAAGGEASWGQNKADATQTEWISLIGGPTMDFFNTHLDEAIANKTIPFEPTLGQYITPDEAVARYQALKDFFTANGHMYEGTGGYYLASVDLNAGSGVVKNFADSPDLSDRWARFSTPPLAEGTLDGPAQVTIGQPADFTLTLTNKAGDPYPSSEVKAVKFLLYDETGATVYVGEGTPTDQEGVFTLSVPPDVTSGLTAGTGRIEAAAALIPAAIPAFASLDYVVSP
jgi:peptide/nickel transport system substrate-binding protein